MAHRHLVLAYVITWVFQLGYLAWLGFKWRTQKKIAARQEILFHN